MFTKRKKVTIAILIFLVAAFALFGIRHLAWLSYNKSVKQLWESEETVILSRNYSGCIQIPKYTIQNGGVKFYGVAANEMSAEIDPHYFFISPYSCDGLVAVKFDASDAGYIRYGGTQAGDIVARGYYMANDFFHNFGVVVELDSYEWPRKGLVNASGKEVLPTVYNKVFVSKNGFIFAAKETWFSRRISNALKGFDAALWRPVLEYQIYDTEGRNVTLHEYEQRRGE